MLDEGGAGLEGFETRTASADGDTGVRATSSPASTHWQI
jgi:hypothetical protein